VPVYLFPEGFPPGKTLLPISQYLLPVTYHLLLFRAISSLIMKGDCTAIIRIIYVFSCLNFIIVIIIIITINFYLPLLSISTVVDSIFSASFKDYAGTSCASRGGARGSPSPPCWQSRLLPEGSARSPMKREPPTPTMEIW